MYQLDPIDNPNFWLCDTEADLPDFTGATYLYQDFETENNTAGLLKNNKHCGMYPFKGDRICGAAVTADLCPDIFYIAVRHKSLRGNISVEAFREWQHKHLVGPNRVKHWVNHNVVFDAIFLHYEGIEFLCDLICTLTLSKVHDSDRIGHGLKVLAAEWLDMPECAKAEWQIKDYLKANKSNDYSLVPPERMGVYACLDAKAARALFNKLLWERPDGVEGIWNTEMLLAAILYDMELQGLLIDPIECKKQLVRSLRMLIDTSTRISELTDREFTNSSTCLQDILCNKFGLPVLKTVMARDEDGRVYDTGRVSFDKEALALYEVHPEVKANGQLSEVVSAIKSYRKEATFSSLFLESFIDLHDEDNYVHPSYNAIVRTGRMSARRPNSQQQNYRSKKLILAPPGYAIWSSDYSQIEYRLIVHYINDLDAIAAYQNDPRTDFHLWVAGMLGVKRKAGKTLNFGMAYGAGKKKVMLGLVHNPEIIAEIGDEVNAMVARGDIEESDRRGVFNDLCEQRASRVYDDYHERFPGVKNTSREAARVCKRRGYVFNAYGRRRHLPAKAAHKAFNSIIQGCAMDIMKERMIALSPRYNERTREMGIILGGNVHDELFGLMPVEHMMNPEYHDHICTTLENPSIEFRVPIMTGLGVSDRNWSEAAGDLTRFEDGCREVTDGNYEGAIAGKLR